MRGRLLLNALLLAAAVLLALWIWRGGQPPLVDQVSALAPEAIERIVIEPAAGQGIDLVRTEQGWRLRAPRELPASQHHLEMLLQFLQLPVAARYPSATVDLAGAGLAAPMLTVSFNGSSYAFGGLDPLGQRRYLLHDNEVLLVQEGVSAILISPWWNFIDRRLLPEGMPRRLHFSNDAIAALTLDQAQAAHWQQGAAAIVVPQPNDVQGEAFELELASGQRIPWQWIKGEQPGLLRPDLGLLYRLGAEQLDGLLGPQ